MQKFILLLLLSVPLISNALPKTSKKNIYIAAGDVQGIYYPVALSLCNQIDKSLNEKQMACEVIKTSGSEEAISMLQKGQVDFAITQGSILNELEHKENLRGVFALYDESLAIIVPKDSIITKDCELKGKKVYAGKHGSGTYVTKQDLCQAHNWQGEECPTNIFEIKNVAKSLCNKEIDAVMMVTGHPNALIYDLLNECEIRFVNIGAETLDNLIKLKPHYSKSSLSTKFYFKNHLSLNSIVTKSYLVTKKDIDDEIVDLMLHKVITNFESFRKSFPVIAKIDLHYMLNYKLPIPKHIVIENFINLSRE